VKLGNDSYYKGNHVMQLMLLNIHVLPNVYLSVQRERPIQSATFLSFPADLIYPFSRDILQPDRPN
jgi:hypothetical protein